MAFVVLVLVVAMAFGAISSGPDASPVKHCDNSGCNVVAGGD